MIDAFLERQFPRPLTDEEVSERVGTASGCFDLYKVAWQMSFLANDRQRMFCWFRSPDLESIRVAVRGTDTDLDSAVGWIGTILPTSWDMGEDGHVIVERSFSEPISDDEIQAMDDKSEPCLATHKVHHLLAFVSSDRKRMNCLYKAPDAESVRQVQRQAALPFDAIWSGSILRP